MSLEISVHDRSRHLSFSLRFRVAIAAAFACVVGGAIMARVRDESLAFSESVYGATPTFRLRPAVGQPIGTVVLGHGVTASKETLFALAEALALQGFDCIAFDFPGHGASSLRFRARENRSAISDVVSAVGRVDIYVGHSVGAYAGRDALAMGIIAPRLFIALGALPRIDTDATPLLLLAGAYEELLPSRYLSGAANAGASMVVAPYADHVTEPYDAVLIEAAVRASLQAMDRSRSRQRGTRFGTRILGAILAVFGGLWFAWLLATQIPQLGVMTGPVTALIVIAAVCLGTVHCCNAWPAVGCVPTQLASIGLASSIMLGWQKLRLQPWHLCIAPLLLAAVFWCVHRQFFALVMLLMTSVVAAGVLVGALSPRERPMDQALGFSVFVGYAIGRWCPMMF